MRTTKRVLRPNIQGRGGRVKDKNRIQDEGGKASEAQCKAVANVLKCGLRDPRITRLSRAEANLLLGANKAVKKFRPRG